MNTVTAMLGHEFRSVLPTNNNGVLVFFNDNDVQTTPIEVDYVMYTNGTMLVRTSSVGNAILNNTVRVSVLMKNTQKPEETYILRVYGRRTLLQRTTEKARAMEYFTKFKQQGMQYAYFEVAIDKIEKVKNE